MREILLVFLMINVTLPFTNIYAKPNITQHPIKTTPNDFISINAISWQNLFNIPPADELEANAIQTKMPALPVTYTRYRQKRVANKLKTINFNQSAVNPDIYELVVSEFNNLKYKYDHNPYVSIAGLGLDMGEPHTVTVSIDFKG